MYNLNNSNCDKAGNKYNFFILRLLQMQSGSVNFI